MYAGTLLSIGMLFLFAVTATSSTQEASPPVLAGWLGVFPEANSYSRTFEKPKVDKQAYHQTARYEWTGGRIETIHATLLKDAGIAAVFTKQGIKGLPKAPEEVKVGTHTGYLWAGRTLVIVLGKDRLLKLDAPTWKLHESDLIGFAKHFPLDQCAKALEQPPRVDFRRKVEAFRELRKGMSHSDVSAWVGDAEQDIGKGIHILTYRLDDGSRVLIGFPDFNRLIYVKHEDKAGKVVELAK